jgi:hypothetical protein
MMLEKVLTKKYVPLLVSISFPAVVILYTFFRVYLPVFFYHPHYNFLYIYGADYTYGYYSVLNNKVIQNTEKLKNADDGNTHLFIYNVKENKSYPLTYKDVQKYTVLKNTVSPDGYQVISGDNAVTLPLLSSKIDYRSKYLKNGNVMKKLNFENASSSYYDFSFLGWIK